jgi:predicted ATPase
MIRDAAYQSLLRTTRQRLHRRVAETLIDRIPQVAAAHPELIAHHLTEAGQAERAIAYWQQSGQRAVARSANVEAIRQLDRGLAGVARLPDGPDQARQELEIRTLLGIALISSEGYGSEAVEQNFARARELCGTIGESPQLFRVLYGLWLFSIGRAEKAGAAEAAERMLRFAERSGDVALQVHGHYAMGVNACYQGEHRQAQEHLAESLGLYDPIAHRSHALLYGRDPAVLCHIHLGLTLWCAGHPDRALQSIERGLSLARALGHPFSLALTLTFGAFVPLLRREPELTQAMVEEGLALAKDQQFRMLLGISSITGHVLSRLGHDPRGAFEEGEEAQHSSGTRIHLVLALACAAEHYLRAGVPAKALRKLDEALAMGPNSVDHWYEPEVHRLRGDVLGELAADDTSAIAACFHRSRDLARRQGARSFELRAATSLARLWQRQGKRAEARDLLQPVYDWFTEGFDTQDLKDAKALLEELGA